MSDYSLKRHFDGGCARELARHIEPVMPDFDTQGYVAEVDARVGPLELKDRVLVLTQGLRTRLPQSYPDAVNVLLESLGPELGEGEGMFNTSWYLMPVARYVEEFGLDHPEVSLAAIDQITRRHTGEYAIRPYLRDHHQLTMDTVRQWAGSPSLNVRRLATEGIRPRLPWAPKFAPFILDPGPVIEILDHLIDDPSPYVRKSVANNLNDISRDHPDQAVKTARRWLASSNSDRTRWITRHGLRTLIKNGDTAALAVVGASADPAVMVTGLSVSPKAIKVGDALTINAVVKNEADGPKDVVVDYSIHFRGRDGRTRPRVFKLTRVQLDPGQSSHVHKTHVLRQLKSRTYYPGTHAVNVQVNGTPSAPVNFVLEVPS